MDPHARLEDLKAVARKLSLEIEFSDLSDPEVSIKSGYCKFKDRAMVILDKNLPTEEQIDILLRELKRFDLENIYLPSWARERLENQDPPAIET
ncbi:MAG: hypothetical protein HZA02_01005 [Nitrospinae bacterium]|nr:hypothetical protein [Nitrospinota bacterium]